MHWLRCFSLLILLASPPLASGGNADLPPDPSQLEPDWWRFFVIDPEQEGPSLAERVAAATTRLETFKTSIPLEGPGRVGSDRGRLPG